MRRYRPCLQCYYSLAHLLMHTYPLFLKCEDIWKWNLKNQKHRPMATLITRTDCSCWWHNTTPSSAVLSSLISSIPNKLRFFVSLPSIVRPLQTDTSTISSMNFAMACLPVCLDNVKLSRASCPIQQTVWGTSFDHLAVPFWCWTRSPCQCTLMLLAASNLFYFEP